MLVWSSEFPQIRDVAVRRLGELGYETWPADRIQAAAVLRDGQVAALVVYSSYQPRYRALEMSILADSPRWATRPVIWALFAYPFEQLQVQRVSSAIRADNTRSIRLCEGLGFTQEGRIRLGYGDCDALVFGLLAEEWKGGKYGQSGRIEHGRRPRAMGPGHDRQDHGPAGPGTAGSARSAA